MVKLNCGLVSKSSAAELLQHLGRTGFDSGNALFVFPLTIEYTGTEPRSGSIPRNTPMNAPLTLSLIGKNLLAKQRVLYSHPAGRP